MRCLSEKSRRRPPRAPNGRGSGQIKDGDHYPKAAPLHRACRGRRHEAVIGDALHDQAADGHAAAYHENAAEARNAALQHDPPELQLLAIHLPQSDKDT